MAFIHLVHGFGKAVSGIGAGNRIHSLIRAYPVNTPSAHKPHGSPIGTAGMVRFAKATDHRAA